jgi:hypothetical protein
MKNIEFKLKVLKRKKGKARSPEELKRCDKEILDLEKKLSELRISGAGNDSKSDKNGG